MSGGQDAFEVITSSLDYPMCIVTTAHLGERSGCLVGFHTQCSIDPHRYLICISNANHTYRVGRHAHAFVVHFLREDQEALARLFGEETADEVDKFERCAWCDGPDGVPVLAGCDWIAGRVLDRFDLGDHEGQLLEVFDAGVDHERASQLGFQRAKRMEPGHPA